MARESYNAIMLLFLKAKLGDELLDYKDLAALPKIKAIYNIDRPDMLSYSPYVSYPVEDRTFGEVKTTQTSLHEGITNTFPPLLTIFTYHRRLKVKV